ncbi:hypothetical protein [Streptomyces sp. H34-S4]|uniref:hypothetical protein n=1 Tax=Streptomyces sp. H34-S4 TaxID=2996463 RepID=UPI00226F8F3C|nr:hypothetical protein [Streptomyces sp. H34-S4]MCY0939526.1 hypothetical protein [Streptomyces sp. H34-S4]
MSLGVQAHPASALLQWQVPSAARTHADLAVGLLEALARQAQPGSVGLPRQAVGATGSRYDYLAGLPDDLSPLYLRSEPDAVEDFRYQRRPARQSQDGVEADSACPGRTFDQSVEAVRQEADVADPRTTRLRRRVDGRPDGVRLL